MSIEQNKSIVQRFYEEVLNGRNVSLADQLLAADYVDHAAPPGAPPGPEGFRQFLAFVSSTFPDAHITVEDVIAESDKVAARFTLRGTQKGAFFGFPATGKSATWTGIDIIRLAGDKLVERWGERDYLGLLQQLGAIPPPAQRE